MVKAFQGKKYFLNVYTFVKPSILESGFTFVTSFKTSSIFIFETLPLSFFFFCSHSVVLVKVIAKPKLEA